jgi:hypothetical protein
MGLLETNRNSHPRALSLDRHYPQPRAAGSSRDFRRTPARSRRHSQPGIILGRAPNTTAHLPSTLHDIAQVSAFAI